MRRALVSVQSIPSGVLSDRDDGTYRLEYLPEYSGPPISRARIVQFAPAYDLLNSAIVLGPDAAESALPLGGKLRGLTRRLLIDYLGAERCRLPPKEIDSVLSALHVMVPQAGGLIEISFLSEQAKLEYAALVEERASRLFR